jgi:hypothetical protein
MVTAGTYLKAHHFRKPHLLDFLLTTLFSQADKFGWQLQARALFPVTITASSRCRHGLVAMASAYPWCSAAWFETATRAFLKTVNSFKTDRISIEDDFEVVCEIAYEPLGVPELAPALVAASWLAALR